MREMYKYDGSLDKTFSPYLRNYVAIRSMFAAELRDEVQNPRSADYH